MKRARTVLAVVGYALGPVAVAIFLNSRPLPVEHESTAAAPPCEGMVLEEHAACLNNIDSLKNDGLGTAAAITIFMAASM